MDFPTYTDPTQAQAQASPEYQQQSGAIDAQAGLNQQTYAQNRQDTINSYQSALDQINLGLKQAGINSRASYAGRNLYNAEGDVSGIGQGVGAANVAPYLQSISHLQSAHETNLAKLGTQEAQGRLDIQNQKYSALQGVLGNLRTSARDTYNEQVKASDTAYNRGQDTITNTLNQNKLILDQQKAEVANTLATAKLPNGSIDTAKIQQQQQAKGRTLLRQADLATALKQYGKDALLRIGNQTYLLGAKERLALTSASLTNQQKLNKLNKVGTVGTPGSTGGIKQDASGLSFFGPKNKPWTAAQYAKANNQSIDQILSQSNNPSDKQFVADYRRGIQSVGQQIIDPVTGKTKKLTTADVLKELKGNPQYRTIFGGF